MDDTPRPSCPKCQSVLAVERYERSDGQSWLCVRPSCNLVFAGDRMEWERYRHRDREADHRREERIAAAQSQLAMLRALREPVPETAPEAVTVPASDYSEEPF